MKIAPIIIPELRLVEVIQLLLNQIRADYETHKNIDEKNSLLYRLFGEDTIVGKYNLFNQAKAIFLKEPDAPRLLEVELFFNAQRANIPTIHITLPSEMKGDEDGIGIDQSFEPIEYNDIDGTYRDNFSRHFNSKFNVVITSDNSLEVVTIYHTLRALLIPFIEHLALMGFDDPKLGGFDLQINSNLVPENIFSRAISIDFGYTVTVPAFTDKSFITKLSFLGKAVDNC